MFHSDTDTEVLVNLIEEVKKTEDVKLGKAVQIALNQVVGAYAIAVFDKDGTLLSRLTLPVIRPTNCKFDKISSQLWITSASEGLSKEQMSLYPASGNTLVYDLELRS